MSLAEAGPSYLETAMHTDGVFQVGLLKTEWLTAAEGDPQTIFVPGTNAPYGVALAHQKSFRQNYFEDRVGADRPFMYFSGWDGLAEEFGVSTDEAADHLVRELGNRGAALVFEQSDQRDSKKVFDDSLARLGLQGNYVLGAALQEQGAEFKPLNYIFLTEYEGEVDGKPKADVYQAYEDNYGSEGRLRMLRELTPEQIEKTYAYYRASFREVSEHDPVQVMFSEDEYADAMIDPDYFKFVVFDKVEEREEISCVSFATKAQNLYWLNQRTLRARFPEQYDEGKVFSAIGTFRRPGATLARTLGVFSIPARAFKSANWKPGVILETNDVAVRNIADLYEMSTNRSGSLTIAVGKPVVAQQTEVLVVG